MNEREKYVEDYYKNNYESILIDNMIDDESLFYSQFLIKNVIGKTLDIGCGCSLQFNSLYMPYSSEIDGVDITAENIDFTIDKIKSFNHENYTLIGNYVKSLGIENYSTINQIAKINNIIQGDFTKPDFFFNRKECYDTIVSTFSLGCVKDENEYKQSLNNIQRLLKKNGCFIHLGTSGKNYNTIIPEMTYNGLNADNDGSGLLRKYFKDVGFNDIKIFEKEIIQSENSMYNYDKIIIYLLLKNL